MKILAVFLPSFFKLLRIHGSSIGQEEHHIGLGQAFQSNPDHFPVHHFPGLVQAWGIEHDDLIVRPVDDPQYPVPGRLWPGSDDGDLLPEEPVEKGRFPGIGRADNSDHS